MAPGDRADLHRNPTAGLAAIMSAKSSSAWVGDQYHRHTASVPMELLGKFEAALRAEIDVDQYDLRPQLFGAPERLGAGCGHADDRDRWNWSRLLAASRKGA
jgi:hypothetical protein